MEPSSDKFEHEVIVVAVADAREEEEGRIFRNK